MPTYDAYEYNEMKRYLECVIEAADALVDVVSPPVEISAEPY